MWHWVTTAFASTQWAVLVMSKSRRKMFCNVNHAHLTRLHICSLISKLPAWGVLLRREMMKWTSLVCQTFLSGFTKASHSTSSLNTNNLRCQYFWYYIMCDVVPEIVFLCLCSSLTTYRRKENFHKSSKLDKRGIDLFHYWLLKTIRPSLLINIHLEILQTVTLNIFFLCICTKTYMYMLYYTSLVRKNRQQKTIKLYILSRYNDCVHHKQFYFCSTDLVRSVFSVFSIKTVHWPKKHYTSPISTNIYLYFCPLKGQ